MENANYATLNRQSGLLRNMATVAQNLANASTTGYRAERTVFSELVADLGPGRPSLSTADASARFTEQSQGALELTGGTFDFAIEGEGYFLLGTPNGERLTRAGAFALSPEGTLVAPDGAQLLDAGGAPIFVPGNASSVSIGADGTLSVDGDPVAQVGLWEAEDPLALSKAEGVRFDPGDAAVPIEGGNILQGYVESSNVDSVQMIARMIEVQRAYELGQSFLDREDERVRTTVRLTGE